MTLCKMRNLKFSKVIVALAVLVIVIGITLNFVNSSQRQSSGTPAAVKEIVERRELSQSVKPSARELSAVEDDVPASNDALAQMLALKLPREMIEEYLTQHHRDAASLIAAFYASGDTNNPVGDINYLKEAATNLPNDPHVQCTVLAQWTGMESAGFSEDRRKWLDAFKVSSPNNALANYLSAEDFFKNGQTEAGVNEVLAATSKSEFGNYALEAFLGEGELYRASGKSPLDVHYASARAMAEESLPELPRFKGLALSMKELQRQYLNANDANSAENLAQMGLALANRLNSGEGGKLVIDQYVGMSIEYISLQNLNPESSYDFLGGKTPNEKMAEIKQRRESLKELAQVLFEVEPKMSEAEKLSFMDRQRIFGEVEAMRWLQQRYGTKAP